MSQNVGFDANKLITLAAKAVGIIGVGQVLSGQDVQDCFDTLNIMLDEWSEERPCVYHLVDINFPCDNSQSYTIGVGGKINTTFVPPKLASAYITLANVNYPLEVIHAKEDWIRIALPGLSAFPKYVFLDTDYPLAKLNIWPTPNASYSCTIQAMAPLVEFQYLTDAVNLRPVYRAALLYNLAVQIAPLFGLEASSTVMRRAASSKRTMMRTNNQIGLLLVDKSLIRNGRYNILSDRSY